MKKFTTAQTLPSANAYFTAYQPDVLVALDANGGTIDIDVDQGDGTFVPIEGSPFSADIAFKLDVAYARIKVTPAGGATFAIGGML